MNVQQILNSFPSRMLLPPLLALAAPVWAADAGMPLALELQQTLQAEAPPQCELPPLRSAATIASLQRLYREVGYQPLWQQPQRLGALREQIRQLADDGLLPDEYPAALQATPALAVCDELRLSSELLLALEHLSQGRLPPPAHEVPWVAADVPTASTADPVALALAGLDDPALAFDQARPQLPLYRELRQAWQALDKRTTPFPVIAPGALLKVGMSDPRVPTLAARLAVQGYLDAALPVADSYDAGLEAAVRRFQADHGVQPDGVVGPLTLAMLNLSPADRLAQIRINLERLRWLNLHSEPDLLLVNIAAGDIRLYRDDTLQWRARVQTGRPARPTPLLVSRVSRLTLNPSWTVPPTIMREDALPQIRRDPDYLVRNQLAVLDAQGQRLNPAEVDWSRPAGILLRQPPGPANPLGKVVFRFDNPEAVFLHDTPSQHLFARTGRNFSSGCVRVEAALALADLLLADLPAAEQERVAQLLASGQTHEIPLPGGPLLILGYWTAEAGSSGQVLMLPDPYRLDPDLLAALAVRPAAGQVALQESGTIGCDV